MAEGPARPGFDGRTLATRAELHGHGNDVWGVAFSPDGRRIASGGLDRWVFVWDVETGRLLLEPGPSLVDGGGPARHGSSTFFTPGGTRIVAASGDAVSIIDGNPVEAATGR